MAKNSKKDPELIAAVVTTKKMLAEVAEICGVVQDEFILKPWWVGAPPADTPGMTNYWRYPGVYGSSMARYLPDEVAKSRDGRNSALWAPKDAVTGAEYHTIQIYTFRKMLEDGWPEWNYIKDDKDRLVKDTNGNYKYGKVMNESPLRFLDRLRKELRTLWRFDEKNLFTFTFALLECAKDGKPREDTSAKVVPGQALPRVQMYEAKPVKPDDPRITDNIKQVSIGLRAVYDFVGAALLPKAITSNDRLFLEWMKERGGSATMTEVNSFLNSKGLPGGGQLPVPLKIFCDKVGKPGSKTPWVVRDEALALLDKAA